MYVCICNVPLIDLNYTYMIQFMPCNGYQFEAIQRKINSEVDHWNGDGLAKIQPTKQYDVYDCAFVRVYTIVYYNKIR